MSFKPCHAFALRKPALTAWCTTPSHEFCCQKFSKRIGILCFLIDWILELFNSLIFILWINFSIFEFSNRVEILNHTVFKSKVLVGTQHEGKNGPNHSSHTTNKTENQIYRVNGPLSLEHLPWLDKLCIKVNQLFLILKLLDWNWFLFKVGCRICL